MDFVYPLGKVWYNSAMKRNGFLFKFLPFFRGRVESFFVEFSSRKLHILDVSARKGNDREDFPWCDKRVQSVVFPPKFFAPFDMNAEKTGHEVSSLEITQRSCNIGGFSSGDFGHFGKNSGHFPSPLRSFLLSLENSLKWANTKYRLFSLSVPS